MGALGRTKVPDTLLSKTIGNSLFSCLNPVNSQGMLPKESSPLEGEARRGREAGSCDPTSHWTTVFPDTRTLPPLPLLTKEGMRGWSCLVLAHATR